MKRLIVLAAILVFPLTTLAKVWTTVYRCDGLTPLEVIDPNRPILYRDIMVGTRLVLVISSDAPGYYTLSGGGHALWNGILQIPWADWERGQGTLSGRGYNEQWLSYQGSCLPAAGRPPVVSAWYRVKPAGVGFEFDVDRFSVAGNWFVIDYHAKRVGACHVEFYDHVSSLLVPAETISFNHVPSRDFNGDTTVDFRDLALLAAHWGSTVPADANSPGIGCDLNADGHIDMADLSLFSEYWLEPTDCGGPAADPKSL